MRVEEMFTDIVERNFPNLTEEERLLLTKSAVDGWNLTSDELHESLFAQLSDRLNDKVIA